MHKLSLVNFADSEPSEKEFFEEYSRYGGSLNCWFVLLFILRSFGPFCLGSQMAILESAEGVNHYMQHFDLECNRATKNAVNKNLSSEWVFIKMLDTALEQLLEEFCLTFAEIADKKNRLFCIYTIPTYIVGGLLTFYISQTISSWIYQQSTIASTVIIMIFTCWYMPESPRWLYNKHKKEKAYAQLCEISGLLYRFQLNRNLENPELENNNVLFDMFAFLCRRTKKYLILCNLLMTASGLSYNSLRIKNMLRHIHTKQYNLLSRAAEVLSFLFLLPVYMILGKRVGLSFMYIVFVILLLMAAFTYDFEQAYIDIFGVIFSMTAINIIWLLILDIFPTFLRGTAIGIGFFFFGFSGTLGYILAKLIEKIEIFNYYLIFFVANLFGIMVLALPDTTNRELPNYKLN
ncbi:solute carrier family 22 member 7-like isoform X2 [Tenebrio molitor]|uniref:solute carrier family 22 member 7-like isoform X2 n=1 Tax=Tenebrio molitor TaxID=7067 RepID=UPI003624A814